MTLSFLYVKPLLASGTDDLGPRPLFNNPIPPQRPSFYLSIGENPYFRVIITFRYFNQRTEK